MELNSLFHSKNLNTEKQRKTWINLAMGLKDKFDILR